MNVNLFASRITHLPPAECKRLVGLLDKLIEFRNTAAALWTRHHNPRHEDFDAALKQLYAARTTLTNLLSLPERWLYLHELTYPAPKAVPRGEDNKSIVAEIGAFRGFVAGRKAARRKNSPPLSDREQDVLDLIAAQPPAAAILGKTICQQTGIGQSTLTAHIIPKLKRWYGVKNRRAAGYYLAI